LLPFTSCFWRSLVDKLHVENFIIFILIFRPILLLHTYTYLRSLYPR
jgi:hypothetical protein